MPLKHAFTMGLSGIKTKPVKLVFTTILCTFAFILFGLFTTMITYNKDKVFNETALETDSAYVKISKRYDELEKQYEQGTLRTTYTNNIPAYMTNKEIEELESKFKSSSVPTIFNNLEIMNTEKSVSNYSYYQNHIYGVGVLEENHELRKK